MDNKTDFLDPSKAAKVNPFYKPGGYIPNYIKAGSKVSVEVRSREMEQALIRAYDYGIGALNKQGLELIQRFIDDALVEMKG